MLALLLAAAGSLDDRIDAVVRDTPEIRQAHWGLHAVHSATGRVLAARNAAHTFIPASNTKLFSTALALSRLGAGHRFTTSVVEHPDGSLRIVGGGDCTLSARPIPYVRNGGGGNPLAPLESLADQVVRAGVTRVRGGIVGDDTAYVWEPYPDGWAQDDTLFEYGAPVSALVLHDNYVTVHLRPGAPPRLSLSPPTSYLTFDVRARPDGNGANRVWVNRAPGSRHIELGGVLNRPSTLELAIDDPALYAAFALREALVRRGVAVEGGVSARHRHPGDPAPAPPPGREVARRVSPPLVETLKTIDKVSQNLQAEVVLREVARRRGAEPSRQAGVAEMRRFLDEIGVPPDSHHFEDGSGLSRLTLASPAAITALLRHMDRPEWADLMPVGGVDGTLHLRYRDLRGGRVMAKTGTITHVGTLSGYLEDRRGERVVFSVMVNNANLGSAAIRGFIDKLVAALIE
jgi:D-alanyl-D-alanine carboxypeptidase/D-alanyl-D-alanine-endopeptidase (penicillin-binding protein 4)